MERWFRKLSWLWTGCFLFSLGLLSSWLTIIFVVIININKFFLKLRWIILHLRQTLFRIRFLRNLLFFVVFGAWSWRRGFFISWFFIFILCLLRCKLLFRFGVIFLFNLFAIIWSLRLFLFCWSLSFCCWLWSLFFGLLFVDTRLLSRLLLFISGLSLIVLDLLLLSFILFCTLLLCFVLFAFSLHCSHFLCFNLLTLIFRDNCILTCLFINLFCYLFLFYRLFDLLFYFFHLLKLLLRFLIDDRSGSSSWHLSLKHFLNNGLGFLLSFSACCSLKSDFLCMLWHWILGFLSWSSLLQIWCDWGLYLGSLWLCWRRWCNGVWLLNCLNWSLWRCLSHNLRSWESDTLSCWLSCYLRCSLRSNLSHLGCWLCHNLWDNLRNGLRNRYWCGLWGSCWWRLGRSLWYGVRSDLRHALRRLIRWSDSLESLCHDLFHLSLLSAIICCFIAARKSLLKGLSQLILLLWRHGGQICRYVTFRWLIRDLAFSLHFLRVNWRLIICITRFDFRFLLYWLIIR